MMDWPALTSLLSALAGYAWPAVVLVIALLFKRELSVLLTRLRKGKLLGQELELEPLVDDLKTSVGAAESEAENVRAAPGDGDEPETDAKPVTVDVARDEEVAEVLAFAGRSPSLALIRLGTLIEASLREVAAASGLADPTASLGPQALIRRLAATGRLLPNTEQSLDIFWQVRNRVVHGRGVVPDEEALSVLDIGLSLLRLVRATPHEVMVVRESDVPLYEDAEARNTRADVVGVLLEVTSPGRSRTEYRILPTTRRGYYRAGMRVSWDFDMTNTWGPTWYRPLDDGQITLAWDSAAEFAGRPIHHEPNPRDWQTAARRSA